MFTLDILGSTRHFGWFQDGHHEKKTKCLYYTINDFNEVHMMNYLLEKVILKVMLYIVNSKLCFCDMKIMSRRNGGDSVNNESAGRVVYQVTTIPE